MDTGSCVGQWRTTSGVRSQEIEMSQSTAWDAVGTWSISSGGYNLNGSYTDQSSQLQSTSNRSTQTFDPQTDQWESENRNSHSNSSLIDRSSSGSGSYSHDRFGYDVSGAATTLNSYRHETRSR